MNAGQPAAFEVPLRGARAYVRILDQIFFEQDGSYGSGFRPERAGPLRPRLRCHRI